MSFSFPQPGKNLGVSLLFLSESRASIYLAFTATNTLAQYFPSFVKGEHCSSLPVGTQVLPGTLSSCVVLPQWTQWTSSSKRRGTKKASRGTGKAGPTHCTQEHR
ncbi:hypothetical protein E2C01_019078 [Portunus trituberculatus]|uniref:Uncharacterized protein n=1 Tax=Portunus trituberculatus TaxID=210409 RepID=A0A5B7DYU6_PORTR|nr:hypothetical protein [Portunus trituberculatus]